jgi:hypothetical protein
VIFMSVPILKNAVSKVIRAINIQIIDDHVINFLWVKDLPINLVRIFSNLKE